MPDNPPQKPFFPAAGFMVFGFSFGAVLVVCLSRWATIPGKPWVAGGLFVVLLGFCLFLRHRFTALSNALMLSGDKLTQALRSQKEAEESQKRSETFKEKVIDNNYDCIFTLDKEEIITFANERSPALLEAKSRSQLIGKPWRTLLPPAEQKIASEALSSAQAGKKLTFNLYWPTFTGIPKWWEVTASLLDRGHTDQNLMVIARDITGHILAEKALREREAAFRKIFEENSIGMVLIDLNFKITETNNAISSMLGYTQKELLGRDVRDLSFPADQTVDAEGIESLLQGQSSTFQCEKRYVTKRKEVVWGHLIASLLHDYDGKPIYMIQMIENIDERKNSEKQLLAYQEQLQSLASELALSEERERRRIATNLHDQIGQTLAFARLKLGTLKKSLPEDFQSTTGVSEVQSLIDQAIVDTRSLTFELSPPVLYELGLVPAVEWLARKFQKEHGIATRFNDDGLVKPLDDNFRIVLFQAVRELLVNIVKHARATHVQVLIRRDADAIRIIIEDDGTGFDTASIHSHGDPNRGFGLFNIRERVEYLGGKVKLRSEHGHGTRVTLIAPLKLDL